MCIRDSFITTRVIVYLVNCYSTQKKTQRKNYFSLTLKMSFLYPCINPELPLQNSTEDTELRTTVDKNKQTALNHDVGKETAITYYENTNKRQERLDSSTEVNEDSYDDLLPNRKTSPTPKHLSRTTEDEETLPLVSCRHRRGDRVLLLVLCLMRAAALGLSLLMLFGVLRQPNAKIGKYESLRFLCNFFSLI